MTRLKVDPFGNVSELPKCPHCGKEMGWWAVENMRHMAHCIFKPGLYPTISEETKKSLNDKLRRV